MSRLSAFIAFTALGLSTAGCAGGAQSTNFESVVASQSSQRLVQTYVPPPRNPGLKREKLLGSGGTLTWKPATFKVKRQTLEFVPTISYSMNSLGNGTFPVGLQDSQHAFGEYPAPVGLTLDWMGVLGAEARNLSATFDTGNQQFVISGSALDASTSYSLYVYTADCLTGCYPWTLISTTALGTPINGSLSAPSPLANGFMWSDSNDVFTFDLVH